MKCPLDMWVFQEIMYETRPDVVVETGTRLGGSSAYFASILDLLGKGRVITVDIVDYPDKPQHDRITYLTGSSTSLEIIERIRELISPDVALSVFGPSGTARGAALFTLEGGQRLSRTLVELVPRVDGQVDGYIILESEQPIVAQQVIADRELNFLSAVPATIIE